MYVGSFSQHQVEEVPIPGKKWPILDLDANTPCEYSITSFLIGPSST